MNAKEALLEIKKLLSTKSTEMKFSLTEGKLVDGTVVSYDYETAEIYVIGEDGVSIPAPVGEHQLETGEVLVVTEAGIIAEVKEKPQEEPMAAVVDPTEKIAMLETTITELTAKYDELSKVVADLAKKNEAMKEIVKLSSDVLEILAKETSGNAATKQSSSYAKVIKSEKEERFNNLQTVFQKLKK